MSKEDKHCALRHSLHEFMSAYFRLTNSNLRSQAGEIHPSAHTGAIIFTTGKFQTEVKKEDDSDQCY